MGDTRLRHGPHRDFPVHASMTGLPLPSTSSSLKRKTTSMLKAAGRSRGPSSTASTMMTTGSRKRCRMRRTPAWPAWSGRTSAHRHSPRTCTLSDTESPRDRGALLQQLGVTCAGDPQAGASHHGRPTAAVRSIRLEHAHREAHRLPGKLSEAQRPLRRRDRDRRWSAAWLDPASECPRTPGGFGVRAPVPKRRGPPPARHRGCSAAESPAARVPAGELVARSCTVLGQDRSCSLGQPQPTRRSPRGPLDQRTSYVQRAK